VCGERRSRIKSNTVQRIESSGVLRRGVEIGASAEISWDNGIVGRKMLLGQRNLEGYVEGRRIQANGDNSMRFPFINVYTERKCPFQLVKRAGAEEGGGSMMRRPEDRLHGEA